MTFTCHRLSYPLPHTKQRELTFALLALAHLVEEFVGKVENKTLM